VASFGKVGVGVGVGHFTTDSTTLIAAIREVEIFEKSFSSDICAFLFTEPSTYCSITSQKSRKGKKTMLACLWKASQPTLNWFSFNFLKRLKKGERVLLSFSALLSKTCNARKSCKKLGLPYDSIFRVTPQMLLLTSTSRKTLQKDDIRPEFSCSVESI